MTSLYGHTWWGRQWVRALEHDTGLNRRRLQGGLTFAGQDRVATLSIDPGVVTASVRSGRRLHYRTHLDVRTYPDEAWHLLAERIAGRAGHVAALLDGDLEPAFLDVARGAGLDLLPGAGDLRPRCSCPDPEPPCKHAAAVAYLVAEAIDDDPFVLLHLRGRTRGAVMADLERARASTGPRVTEGGGTDGFSARDTFAGRGDQRDLPKEVVDASPAGPDPGEPAREACARTRAPFPPAQDVPAAPGRPASWPEDPPPDAPFDAPGLLVLAADAARRAWEQLRGDGDSALGLSPAEDLVRRQASGGDGDLPATLGGTDGGGSTARAEAWRHGGKAALAAVDEPAWRPPVATMAAARAALESAGVPPTSLTVHQNRITAPGFQVRLIHDGTWWRFEKRRGRWQIAAPPAEAPDDLVDL